MCVCVCGGCFARWSSYLAPPGLRQDLASTSSVLANRRSQSLTFQLSQLSAGPDLEEEDEEDEEDDEDYGLLPPPQPRLTRLPHSHTFSSIRDWRRSTSSLCTPPSTPSTPLYPSAGFAVQPALQAQSQGLGLGLGVGSTCAAEQQCFRPGSGEERGKLDLNKETRLLCGIIKEQIPFQLILLVFCFLRDQKNSWC